MPMPKWWGHVNRQIFNPRALAGGRWPVLTHTGRTSGTTYRTPLDAYPVDGGYLFILVYGSRSDWVRNVLASGYARLRIDGRDLELDTPRLIDKSQALQALPEKAHPPRLLRITEFLRMDLIPAPDHPAPHP
ncbi:nitroreductase family deazaflavin-dependent oxidoreductase [Nocardia sp. NPDC004722]